MKNKLRLLLASIIITALVMVGCNIRPDDIVVDDSDLIPAILAGGTVPLPYFPYSTVSNYHNATVVDLGDRWYVSADMDFNGQLGQSLIHGGTIRYQMIIAKDRMDFFANPANKNTLQVTVTIANTRQTEPQNVGGMCFWEYFNDRFESTRAGIEAQGSGAILLTAPVFIREVAPQTNRSLAGADAVKGEHNRRILDELGISLNLMIPLTLHNQQGATFSIEDNPAWPGMPYEMPNFGWGQIQR